MTLDEKTVDKRVVRRNIERGRIDGPTYQRMLESLPDCSTNVQRAEALAAAAAAVTAPAPVTPEPSASALSSFGVP